MPVPLSYMKIQMPMGVRYIRDWNGSTYEFRWREIQALNTLGINVALNKLPSFGYARLEGSVYDAEQATDGIVQDGNGAVFFGDGPS